MVAGRLAEKNGYFYIVLSYNGPDGKRVQKWQGTGLSVKGNKKKADELLRQARRAFTPPVPNRSDDLSPDMLFSDYMLYWLEIIRPSVQPTTWSSYCFNVKDHIVPYFEPTGITLGGLQARHIQSFYLHERKTLKSTSVLRLHANLHKALKQAVKLDLIPGNPVDKVERPKPERYMAAYYTAEEMEQLFEAARGHRLELIIQFAAFYGLRRGEVLGLRWDAIDFAAGTFTIRHTVTTASVEGKHLLIQADRAKTKSSLRTLPLVEGFAQRLRALKEQQKYNEKLCGNCYNQKFKGYYHLMVKRIAIDEGMSEMQTIKTLIHEIAHAKLHAVDPDEKPSSEEKKDRHTKEVEAESVAYTVCQRYGLETSDYSFGYIAGWSSDKETKELKGSLETIRKTAAEMIESIDAQLMALSAEKVQFKVRDAEAGPAPLRDNGIPIYRETANYAYPLPTRQKSMSG